MRGKSSAKLEDINMKQHIRKSTIVLPLICAVLMLACNPNDLSTFKSYWNAGVNAFDAFNIAIQGNPNVSQSFKDKSAKLIEKLDPTKPIIAGLTTFPPENRKELADLLADVLPILRQIAGDSSVGTVISTAAAAALTFFQTESDMLAQTGPPSGAAGAPANPAAKLPRLKEQLEDFKAKVKQIK